MPEPTAEAPTVSVVVVNFNVGALLGRCVRSALASTIPVEVIVVDNASTDGSQEAVRRELGGDPRLRFVENPVNRGFAAAANQGLALARGDWLLLLNPDAALGRDTLARMWETITGFPECGIAGCLVLNPDGTEQAGCRRDTPTPGRAFVRAFGLGVLARRLGYTNADFVRRGDPLPAGPVEVDAISGAFMLVRHEAFEKVGPLDEGYFLHCEDLDWCLRFQRAGFKVLFVPGVSIVHDKGGSSRPFPVRVLWHTHRGMARYYRKFFRGDYPAPLYLLVLCGIWARFASLATWTIAQELLRVVFPSGATRSGA